MNSNASFRGCRIEADVIDDCCMTAPGDSWAYLVGKKKPEIKDFPKADMKRISKAVAEMSKYIRRTRMKQCYI